MKKLIVIVTGLLPAILFAQQKESSKNIERIIITKKGETNEKLNIVVDGENITVNGKSLSDKENADITVNRMKIKDLENFNGTMDLAGIDNGRDKEIIFRNLGPAVSLAPIANKAMLGVTTEKAENGAKITSITNESAAEKAGLKTNDIITAVDNTKIESPDDLSAALKDKNPDDKVRITYIRNGHNATINATLTKWKVPQALGFRAYPNYDLNDIFENLPKDFDGSNNNRNYYYRAVPGVSLNSNSPKLGIKIKDVETGSGVEILNVEKGSDAEKAGLKQGDIIKEANGKEINRTDDLLAQKRKSQAGSTLKLKINRSGRSENINVLFSKKIKTADL